MPMPLASQALCPTVGSLEFQLEPPLQLALCAHQDFIQPPMPPAQVAVLTAMLAVPTPHAQPAPLDSTFQPTVHASTPPLPRALVSSSQEWLYYP